MTPADGSPDRHVDASILVPVLNEERYIEAAVDAMRRQRFDGRLEFLFVDGRSTDRTRELLREMQREDDRVHVLDNPQSTTPVSLNIALRAARGDFVVRMDAHTMYPPDYVARGVERLKRGDTEWVSGFQVPYAVDAGSRRTTLALGTWLGRGGSRKWSADTQDGGVPTGDEIELDTGVFAGVWRRETLTELGGWDEGFPQNQDSELAARILARGGRILCLPELSARYIPRNSLRGLSRQYRSYGLYRAKTASRHPMSLRLSLLLSPAITAAVPATVVFPRPLRLLARLAVAVYAGALAVTGGRLAAKERSIADGAGAAAALATMHLSWGFGFLRGAAQFRLPLVYLRRLRPPRAQAAPASSPAEG